MTFALKRSSESADSLRQAIQGAYYDYIIGKNIEETLGTHSALLDASQLFFTFQDRPTETTARIMIQKVKNLMDSIEGRI